MDLFADDESRDPAQGRPHARSPTADTAIERMVRERLATAFPDDRIMGEEEGGTCGGRRSRLDRGPDRRHRQLRPGDPGVGDADRAAGRRRDRGRRGERAGARRAVRGGARRRRDDERQARSASARSARLADAQFLYSQLDTLLAAPGTARPCSSSWPAANRERGFGDFWGHLLVARGAAEICLEPSLAIWDYAALVPIVRGGRRA